MVMQRCDVQYGGTEIHECKQGYEGPTASGYFQQDSHLRNSARSMSATELYQNVVRFFNS